VVSKNADDMAALAGSFSFILDTVSAAHDLNPYLNLLGLQGAMVQVACRPSLQKFPRSRSS
jgi:uncharacterized zinc-type alcohol dehydrogenase-like protein